MDLDFKNDKFRFNARVSAIIYNKDKTKVLLFKVNDGRDFYDGDIDNAKFDCLDNKGQSFYWFDLNKVCDIKIFPNSAKENIFNDNKDVTHFINRV